MKYKVGDTVWLIDLSCCGIITDVRKGASYLYRIEYNRQYGIFTENELHDTFDTMITRLDFEKTTDYGVIVVYEYGEEDTVYLTIDNVDNCYIYDGWVSKDLDKAFSQLMVELNENSNDTD